MRELISLSHINIYTQGEIFISIFILIFSAFHPEFRVTNIQIRVKRITPWASPVCVIFRIIVLVAVYWDCCKLRLNADWSSRSVDRSLPVARTSSHGTRSTTRPNSDRPHPVTAIPTIVTSKERSQNWQRKVWLMGSDCRYINNCIYWNY